MPQLPRVIRNTQRPNLCNRTFVNNASIPNKFRPRGNPTVPAIRTPRSADPSSSHLTSTLPPRRGLHGSRYLRMASDEDYMAFLNKANEGVSGGSGQAAAQSTKVQSKAVDSGTEVPKEIREVCRGAFYVSDADEPFEGVSLRWSGEDGLPDEVEFAKLINHPQPTNAEVEIMDPTDWDRKGQYNELLEAVRQASLGNDVRVYRVTWDRTRVEYWLITRADGKIVGAKALAVES